MKGLDNINGKRSFTYHLGAGAGFYSEYNNMILCMVYCLENHINFNVYSKDAFFFDGEGWGKYFIPFAPEKKSRFHHRYNHRGYVYPINSFKLRLKDIDRVFMSSLYRIVTGNLLTQDIFNFCRCSWFQNTRFNIPEYNIKGENLRKSCYKILKKVYRFNDYRQNQINDLKQGLKLPDKYIGMHVRGGDKITENDVYGIKEYMTLARKISSCRNAFILTDDYQLYQTLVKEYPDWSFYTLTFPDEIGYVNSDFESKTIERREAEMMKVFASVEIIRDAEHFIGTYSSNIGMFLGMVMEPEKISCLDSESWYIL